MVPIDRLDTGVYRICTPGGGLCVETLGDHRAISIAQALYCSSHSSMAVSRFASQ